MTDNILVLDIRPREGVLGRTLRVGKARGIAHDLQAREMKIDNCGLRITEGHG